MAADIQVSITDQPLSAVNAYTAFEAICGDNDGAIAHFCGRCRSENGALRALELEHYPGMAEAQFETICKTALDKWPITRIEVTHRFGIVNAGEPIVLVFAASAHRKAALAGVEFVMDFLKTDAPFWKREHMADGSMGNWVTVKSRDLHVRSRWKA
ncbi:MAG: molybdenum cofactor biosynthesis protein MoaE [Pseudomonadota bacterium]